MLKYAHIVRRILETILTIIGLITLIFLIARVIPGDPVRLMLGPEASMETVERVRDEFGFDQPLWTQYINFISSLFMSGKAGVSILTRHDALADVMKYFPATFELTTLAMGIGVIGGILLGMVSALNRDKRIDHAIRLFTVGGVAIPYFWWGIMLQLVIGYWIGILPITGRLEVGVDLTQVTGLYLLDSILTGNLPALVSSIRCLILPAITLSTSPMANITRIMRASVIEENGKDYVIEAKASGLPANLVRFKYMLRNALSPTITIAGVQYGWLLGNAFVVETVFAWPGMAFYGRDAAVAKDINGVVAVSFICILIFLTLNLLVDYVYSRLDPRIAYGVAG